MMITNVKSLNLKKEHLLLLSVNHAGKNYKKIKIIGERNHLITCKKRKYQPIILAGRYIG